MVELLNWGWDFLLYQLDDGAGVGAVGGDGGARQQVPGDKDGRL